MKTSLLLTIYFISSLASADWVGFKPASDVNVGPSNYINSAVVMLRTVGGTSTEYQNALTMVDMDQEPRAQKQKKTQLQI